MRRCNGDEREYMALDVLYSRSEQKGLFSRADWGQAGAALRHTMVYEAPLLSGTSLNSRIPRQHLDLRPVLLVVR